ncbi:MAG: hypothetical protein ACRCXT_16475, partial [Paraclostridium sp.]
MLFSRIIIKIAKLVKVKNISFKNNIVVNLALSNSKRNSIYILTTAIIVGMAGLYGVQQFITSEQGDSIGDPLLQRLGDYNIDLTYKGISKSDESLISQNDLDNISYLPGVSDIYTFNSTTSYTKMKTKDLSKSYKKNLSIKEDDREVEMKFDFI